MNSRHRQLFAILTIAALGAELTTACPCHLGDVIIEHDDVYGDGVNIAARLEGIANPGDVFVSGGVYEQIKNKLVCAYQSLGDRQVKNITDPISVYRVLPDPNALVTARRGRKRIVLVTLAILMIAALGSAIGFYLWVRHQLLAYQPPQTIEAPKTALTTLPASPVVPPTFPASSPSASAPQPEHAPSAPRSEAAAPNLPAGVSNAPTITRATQSTASNASTALALPTMVSLPGGIFTMGSNDDISEKPLHRVTIKPFAISKFPIINREWKRCVAAKACDYVPAGSDDAPVANVSWNDAKQFVEWLSQVTQKSYRLPSEAEWEYAARGGTQTKYWWGDQFQSEMANCKGRAAAYDPTQPAKVGSFKPNSFGLHDIGATLISG